MIQSYFRFLWTSTNHHGVHSPFVYNLITRCFYDSKIYPEYVTLKQHRKSLLENSQRISVTDFGAGSKVFRSNNRKISEIARNAGITSMRARLLFRIIRYFKPQTILELGTSLGLSTLPMVLGNPVGRVITLEGCPHTAKVAKTHFPVYDGVEFVVTEFSSFLESLQVDKTSLDLVYFDGNHSKEATLDYFEQLLCTTNNDTVWIFDDIHWNKDMESAWETIKNHQSVTVSIDTFWWGLVFFRKEQAKEHFVIRI